MYVSGSQIVSYHGTFNIKSMLWIVDLLICLLYLIQIDSKVIIKAP